MKLSQEQIEEERVKFIADAERKGLGNTKYRRSDFGVLFLDDAMEYRFEGWLACRESNNQITIPEPYFYAHLDGDGFQFINPALLIDALESQGYEVVIK